MEKAAHDVVVVPFGLRIERGGKVALGPFIGRRGASRVERGHSPPLNSPSLRGVGARSRRPMCEIRWGRPTRGG